MSDIVRGAVEKDVFAISILVLLTSCSAAGITAGIFYFIS